MEFTTGPFQQIITMDNLPASGPIEDALLNVIENGMIHIKEGKIEAIGPDGSLEKIHHQDISTPQILLPGFIDAHTHLCYAGTRTADYAARLSGKSYQEIAAAGGGIKETVKKTRAATEQDLLALLLGRLQKELEKGITTCEIKSGYGLTIDEEVKLLNVILEARKHHPIDIISTCLAAHTIPPEYACSLDYLDDVINRLFPLLKEKNLSNRIDIFVEKEAFTVDEARYYLKKAQEHGFSLIVHADQFSRGGALLSAEMQALSADHLEQSIEADAEALKKKHVHPIVLPGASLGLGMPYAPARMLLDEGLPLVIASDWNPGSAPMGNLLAQASILAAAQHLTVAETLAAMTDRAAAALDLNDRGKLAVGKRADMVAFSCADYRDILYYQGSLLPTAVYIKGLKTFINEEKNASEPKTPSIPRPD